MSCAEIEGGNVAIEVVEARKAAGITQAELARRVGIDRKDLREIERGKEPCLDVTLCIAEALDRPFEEVFKRVKRGAIARPGRFIDLTGRRFGRLTVVERAHPTHERGGRSEAFWLCRCECGNESIVRSDHLRDGHTTSCGCASPCTRRNRVRMW